MQLQHLTSLPDSGEQWPTYCKELFVLCNPIQTRVYTHRHRSRATFHFLISRWQDNETQSSLDFKGNAAYHHVSDRGGKAVSVPRNRQATEELGANREDVLQNLGQQPACPGDARHRAIRNVFLISCTPKGLNVGSRVITQDSVILTRANIRKVVFIPTFLTSTNS